jgi:hypothetical protein
MFSVRLFRLITFILFILFLLLAVHLLVFVLIIILLPFVLKLFLECPHETRGCAPTLSWVCFISHGLQVSVVHHDLARLDVDLVADSIEILLIFAKDALESRLELLVVLDSRQLQLAHFSFRC